MKGQIASLLIVVALAIGAGAGYFTSLANYTTKTTTTTMATTTTTTAPPTGVMAYQVINPNATVRGQAAGTPCGALEFPCVTYPNQSITAVLIRYNGAYYYLSYYGTFNKQHTTETFSGGVLSNTWYAIWYDNSTVYCVSPKVQWWNACPPSVIVTFQNDTYLTSCTITGIGGFEFRVVSDTGAPVSGETIEAVDRLGACSQNQVVHLSSFSESQGGVGWLVPDWPSGAIPAGGLTFTISYQGGVNNFTANVPPVGTNCAIFHIPSGNTTNTTVMNGSGSYCS